MAIQIIPGQPGLGALFGQGFGQGLSQGVQSLLQERLEALKDQRKADQAAEGLRYFYPDASPEQLQSLARLDPRIMQGALKGRAAMDARMSATQRARQLIQNLRETERGGQVDTSLFGWAGGQDKDIFDVYGKELKQIGKQIDPALQVPSSKMSKEARAQVLDRWEAALEKLGAPQQGQGQRAAQGIMGIPGAQPRQQMGQAPLPQQFPQGQQWMPDQQQQQQFAPFMGPEGEPEPSPLVEGGIGEGPLRGLLRNLTGATVGAVSPLAAMAGKALAARTGQAALGPLGQIPVISDIAQAAENLIPAGFDKIVDTVGMLMQDPERAERAKQTLRDYRILPKKGEEEQLSKFLPTTENIKSFVSKVLPDNFLEPRSEGERIVQDAVNKGLGLMTFGGYKPLAAAISTASGLTAKEIAKAGGIGPIGQTAAEFVFTMFTPTLYNRARQLVRNNASAIYNDFAEKNAAKMISGEEIRKEVTKIGEEAQEFMSIPGNKKIFDGMTDIENKFVQNNLRVDDAIKSQRAINRMINEMDLTSTDKRKLTGLRNLISETILDEGKKKGMPLIDDYKKANQMWHGLKASESLTEKLVNAVKNKEYISGTIRSFLSREPSAALGAVGLSALTTAPYRQAAMGAAGIYELVQAYRFFSKTPEAFAALAKAAIEVQGGNVKSALARINRIDKEAAEFERRYEARRVRARRI